MRERGLQIFKQTFDTDIIEFYDEQGNFKMSGKQRYEILSGGYNIVTTTLTFNQEGVVTHIETMVTNSKGKITSFLS